MAENKIAIYITFFISTFSLLLSILFNNLSCSFICNLFLGVFASGLVALFIAIINYLIARKRTLERFYIYMLKAASNYNMFDNGKDFDRALNSVIEMSKYDYTELDNAFSDISFLFFNQKNREYIFNDIYFHTVELRNIIELNAWHFKEYYKNKNGNKSAMSDYLSQIDKAIMCRETYEYKMGENTLKTKSSYNKAVREIKEKTSGRLYEIMYPKYMFPWIDKENNDSDERLKKYLKEIRGYDVNET